MKARLTVFFPDRPARRLSLEEGRHYLVGRDPAADVHLDDQRVSHHHAELLAEEGGWICRDLGSKNGSRVDGALAGRAALTTNSWIDVGGVLLQFRLVDDATINAATDSDTRRRATSLRVSRQLDPSRALPQLLGDILDSVLELAGTGRAFLMLENGSGDFEVAARRGLTRRDVEKQEFSGSLAIVKDCLAQRQSIVSCDVAGLSRYAERPSIAGASIRAIACLPLTVREGCRGVIYTDSRTPGRIFDELDLELMESFAERCAVAIGLATLRQSLDSVAGGMQSVSGEDVPLTLEKLTRTHATMNRNDR